MSMRVETVLGDCVDDGPRWQADVIMAMPALNAAIAERCAALMSSRAGAEGLILVILDTAGEGFISLCNRAFAHSDGRYFGYVAEDAFPGRLWLKVALMAIEQRRASLLAFNDGKWLGKMASFGLAERAWAKELYGGSFFHPGYVRHYADYELSRIAQHQSRYWFEPASVLIEVDWEKDRKAPDSEDRALFHRRAQSGFDGRVPLAADAAPTKSARAA